MMLTGSTGSPAWVSATKPRLLPRRLPSYAVAKLQVECSLSCVGIDGNTKDDKVCLSLVSDNVEGEVGRYVQYSKVVYQVASDLPHVRAPHDQDDGRPWTFRDRALEEAVLTRLHRARLERSA